MSTMLPVLTAYEKEHISERQPLPERYLGLSDEETDRRIAAARQALGTRVVTFHRVPYDVEGAMKRIFAANLPDRLATRLKEGR